MNIKPVYFVSGIDTDAGKSYATGFLASQWKEQGINAITQKFIQTGCPEGDISEDIAVHRKIMGIPLLPEDLDHTTAPIRFAYPSSPDLAARLEGKDIDLSLIGKSTEKLLGKYDTVLLEGAGGLMVPIKGQYTTLDYIKEHSLPLILVTNPRLGSISQTLLNLEACRCNAITVDYLVYNACPETSAEITADTRDFLKKHLMHKWPSCIFLEVPRISI